MEPSRSDSLHVSSDVSSDVSLEASPNACVPRSHRQRVRGSSRSPGRYLVRSGSIYLLPTRVLRIGLGPKTARHARAEAELLATLARSQLEEIRMARMEETPSNDDEREAVFRQNLAEGTGRLRLVNDLLKGPPPPTPPHLEPAFAGIRTLITLTRELNKGPDANPLIVQNAELIKQQAFARLRETHELIKRAKKAAADPLLLLNAAQRDTEERKSEAATSLPLQATPAAKQPAPAAIDATTAPEKALEPAKPPAAHVMRDESGKVTPTFQLDRRFVPRKPSVLPRWAHSSAMCNLYNLTAAKKAILEWTRAMRDSASWNEPSLQIYPNYRAPVVRNAPDGVRELAMLTWGMPSPPQYVIGRPRSDQHPQRELAALAQMARHREQVRGAFHELCRAQSCCES